MELLLLRAASSGHCSGGVDVCTRTATYRVFPSEVDQALLNFGKLVMGGGGGGDGELLRHIYLYIYIYIYNTQQISNTNGQYENWSHFWDLF